MLATRPLTGGFFTGGRSDRYHLLDGFGFRFVAAENYAVFVDGSPRAFARWGVVFDVVRHTSRVSLTRGGAPV